MRINTRQELEQRRKEYAASLKMQKKQILICAGTGCVAGGSLDIYARIQEILKERGIKCSLVLELKRRLLEICTSTNRPTRFRFVSTEVMLLLQLGIIERRSNMKMR